MSKNHEEIMAILRDIQIDIAALNIRIDEVESDMLDVTCGIADDLKRIIKRADIGKKRKKKRGIDSVPECDWPIIDADGVIQESGQAD